MFRLLFPFNIGWEKVEEHLEEHLIADILLCSVIMSSGRSAGLRGGAVSIWPSEESWNLLLLKNSLFRCSVPNSDTNVEKVSEKERRQIMENCIQYVDYIYLKKQNTGSYRVDNIEVIETGVQKQNKCLLTFSLTSLII